MEEEDVGWGYCVECCTQYDDPSVGTALCPGCDCYIVFDVLDLEYDGEEGEWWEPVEF